MASFKAADLIADKEHDFGRGLSFRLGPRDKIKLVWKLYIPAAGMGVLTVAAIVCANRIGTRRTAAMAAAYSITEKAFTEYQDKVAEKVGQRKEQGFRDEIEQERITNNPVSTREVIITGGGNVLCYDKFTGRYFQSDVESLKKAQNDLNAQVLNDFYASLTDFYNLIGLKGTSMSDELGWNSDKLMQLRFSTVLSEDGRPCISIDFSVTPIRNYYKLN